MPIKNTTKRKKAKKVKKEKTWREMEYEEKQELPSDLGTVVTLKDFQKAKTKPKDNDDDNTA